MNEIPRVRFVSPLAGDLSMLRHGGLPTFCAGCQSPGDAWAVVDMLAEAALEGDEDSLRLLPCAIEHALAVELWFAD